MDDVILNKTSILKRCLKRIEDEYVGHENEIEYNFTVQDSILLNLQRACEAAIDLGMRVVKLKQLDIPQSSRDIFIALEKEKIISSELSKKMQSMVGFRNIAVHNYQEINLEIVKAILNTRLSDFQEFIDSLKRF